MPELIERTDPASPAPRDDAAVLAALRAGDERAFADLVSMYHAAMVRLARVYVGSTSVAEEVVQDAWVGVLEGLDRFEGRSSLKTWIFRIVMNRAITRAQRERRSIPFSALAEVDEARDESAVDPSRFRPPGDPNAGRWRSAPSPWPDPESSALSNEAMSRVRAAIDTLPPVQRQVITLRDVAGWDSKETCNLLGLSETNQRVLLHRARSRVRAALDRYFEERRRPGAGENEA